MIETIRKLAGAPRRLVQRNEKLRLCVVPVLLVLALAMVYVVQHITLNGSSSTLLWMLHHPGPTAFTVLALALLAAVIWGLSGSLFLAGLLPAVPAIALALINYFKVRVNAAVLEISDFTLAKDLPELARLAEGNLELPAGVWKLLLGYGLLLLIVLWLDFGLRVRWRTRLISAGTALAVLALCLWPLQMQSLRSFDLLPDSRIGQSYSNKVNGLLGGLYRAWVLMDGTPPKGYSRRQMERLIDEFAPAEEARPEAAQQPNIILVLSESFFDATTLPEVQWSADPLPNYHRLAEGTVSGTFYASYCGFNTGIMERSVLTGLHARYLPYGRNICYMEDDELTRLTALPELLRSDGYQTLALHTYTNELYNREEAFPYLGFDRVLFQDDVYDESRVKGGYLSDDYFAELLIENYEEMTADGTPAFLFGISMENHQPYPADKFEAPAITASSPKLNEAEEAMLATVAQGIFDADASLQKLVDYFSGREEPVLLVFFGDHRPALPTQGTTIYQKLGVCSAVDDFYWTPEELKEMYSTSFLAWANYDAFGDTPKDTPVLTGSVGLGSDLLRWAGVPRTRYWRLVEQLSRQAANYTEYVFVDADGAADTKPSEAARPVVEAMEAVLYDAFYGERYVTDILNEKG